MKIGLWELIVVFVVALLVIGPDKLPRYAQMLGKALREFRNATQDMTKELKENVVEPLEKAQEPLREAMEPLEEMDREIRSSVNDVDRSFKDLGKIKKKPAAADKTEKAASPDQKENATAFSEDTREAGEMQLTEPVTEAAVSENL
ncbi:MAG: twin-arginine translocase TatA/TatE family subunit [Lachnospiraceae bacterium]|nr:twin-arginine translocase TatA/TatE family subunit [Lachnospiraceae bacterium]MBQ3974248.1 twin-arginine translocase TatA/TatE family subunit [Lachnospiraceae bacterium]